MSQTIHCTACGTERTVKPTRSGLARLPRGWKRVAQEVLCGECKGARFRLCAITMPVIGPISCDWPTLRALLRQCWAESTRLANWITSECYVRDVRRHPGLEKLSPWDAPYLYPETSTFAVPCQTRAAMEQTLKARYRAIRYQLLWTNEVSLPTYGYPYPFAVPNQAWRARLETGQDGSSEFPVVEVALPGGRVGLRLAGGRDYRRQLGAFRQLVSGEAIAGELSLYRVPARESDGRNGVPASGPSRPLYRVLCKMVAYLPRKPTKPPEGERVLSVRTDAESLLLALDVEGEKLRAWHGDQVRDWCFQHQRWLARMADDSKHERRRPKRRRRRVLHDYESRGTKHRHRVRTWIGQTAAELVGLARRRGCTVLKYDDRDQRFVSTFPWSLLRATVERKCLDEGVRFEHAGGAASAKPAGPLAMEEVSNA